MSKRFARKTENTMSAVTALEKAQELVFAPMTFQAVASLLDFGILQYINNNPNIGKILVVAHGAIIRFFITSVTSDLLKDKVRNCEIYELSYTEQLGFYVDTSQ